MARKLLKCVVRYCGQFMWEGGSATGMCPPSPPDPPPHHPSLFQPDAIHSPHNSQHERFYGYAYRPGFHLRRRSAPSYTWVPPPLSYLHTHKKAHSLVDFCRGQSHLLALTLLSQSSFLLAYSTHDFFSEKLISISAVVAFILRKQGFDSLILLSSFERRTIGKA